MAAFLIETAKALLTFIAVCVGLGVLYLVFVVVREVGWIVKQENRRKYEQTGNFIVSVSQTGKNTIWKNLQKNM